MKNCPGGVRVARILLGLNAVLWLSFAVYAGAGAHPSFGVDPARRWPAALLALLIAAGHGVLSLLLQAPRRPVFWAAVTFLAGIVLMFLFDQFGLADLAVAAATALPLVLLAWHRSWYLQPDGREDHSAA